MIYSSCKNQSKTENFFLWRKIHSVLKLTTKKLSSDTLMKLQDSLKSITYIIMDECSMMGQKLLFKLDQRLKKIRANDLPFGGINMIFVGHFAQLPPVCDKPMWMKPNLDSHSENRQGYRLFKQYKKVIILDEVKRQESNEWLKILNNVCEGKSLISCFTATSRMSLPPEKKNLRRFYVHICFVLIIMALPCLEPTSTSKK